MTSKVLSVLIVGGENSAEAYSGHLASNTGSRGYVPQLMRQLQRVGWQVQIECHTPIDLPVVLPLLQQLNLNRFDLILLELGHTCLAQSAVSDTRPGMVDPNSVNWSAYIKLAALRLLASIGRVGRLRETNAQLTDLFYYVQPHRRRLVMLTPLPHPHPVSNWLRQKGEKLFGQQGRRHLVPVFDTKTIIGRGEEFFADSQQGQLSPAAGDLLGQTLFDYIQTNALLPARPELRQRRR